MRTTDAISLFLDSRQARGDSPHTVKWYRLILEYFAAQYEEIPTTPEAIDKFLRSCKGGDERRHGFWRCLRALYRFLHRRHNIDNPLELMDPPRRKRKLPITLTIDELLHLLTYPHPPDIAAYIYFLADSGARVGELDNLKPEDITRTPWGWVAKLDGKTGQRYTPISDRAYETILPYIPVPYKVDWLTRHISQAFKNAGVRGTAHTLRHTFGTLWKGSEFALKEIMGHSSFEMLRNYRNLRTDTLSQQHQNNSPLHMLK